MVNTSRLTQGLRRLTSPPQGCKAVPPTPPSLAIAAHATARRRCRRCRRRARACMGLVPLLAKAQERCRSGSSPSSKLRQFKPRASDCRGCLRKKTRDREKRITQAGKSTLGKCGNNSQQWTLITADPAFYNSPATLGQVRCRAQRKAQLAKRLKTSTRRAFVMRFR